MEQVTRGESHVTQVTRGAVLWAMLHTVVSHAQDGVSALSSDFAGLGAGVNRDEMRECVTQKVEGYGMKLEI